MPFAALKGYNDFLRAREKIVVDRRSLSEEYKQMLDLKLKQVKKLDMITVIYYENKEYIKKTGIVSRIDESARILQVVDQKIAFDDIYDLISDQIDDAIFFKSI